MPIEVIDALLRYENHISSSGLRMEWTVEEEEKMIELHNEMGNKWALIAQNIPGKYQFNH